MQYMLDTNICSYILKHRPKQVLQKFKSIPEDTCMISSVSLAELRYWVARNKLLHEKSNNPGRPNINEEIINQFVDRLSIEPFGYEAASTYGDMRAYLEANGEPIGSEDLMIGSHALSLNCVLVTNNLREFKRLPGLKLENWVD